MKTIKKFLSISLLIVTLLAFTTATAFADRVVIRDNDSHYRTPQKITRPTSTYQRPATRYKRPTPVYQQRPTQSTSPVNVNVDVNVEVNVPETRENYMPYYYPTFAYDYFIIDYPQDDYFLYRTFPASMGYRF